MSREVPSTPASDLLRAGEVAGVASFGFRTDMELVLASGGTVERRTGYRVIRTPRNPAFYWGNFLLLDGAPGPGAVAAWVGVFEREFPGADYVAIGVDGMVGSAGDARELADAHLAVERSTVLMARRLRPPGHSNSEAEIRMLDVDDDADWASALALKIDNDEDSPPEAFEAYARASLVDKRELQANGAGAWYGAFLDGRMVSGLGVFALGGNEAGERSVADAGVGGVGDAGAGGVGVGDAGAGGVGVGDAGAGGVGASEPGFRDPRLGGLGTGGSAGCDGAHSGAGAHDAGSVIGGQGVGGGLVARYQTVDTLAEYRNRGLAGTLVHVAGRFALDVLGARTLVIVADPDYHAIGLYRSLGFEDAEIQVQLSRY